ncbi:MAG TPA: glutathione S-transferase N-terminal domain-containing protein [Thermoanaerobaculia bacterium]|nr:glutathione S-transferase N-terminal domain-containing protein [Thermoanaerobaculia bacterium]
MSEPTPLLLSGAPGSPYTRKMVALLRYRRIPYQLMLARPESRPDLPQPKVRLLPTFYLPGPDGELEAAVDSSPLIRRFEASHRGRSVTPDDPVVDLVDALLEDYADEWLTKAMFHYRWSYRDDIEKSGDVLPRWRDVSAPEDEMRRQKLVFQERQIERLWVVGSNETTGPVIEASYARFLDAFRDVLERQPFLMGERPGASDFGVYGQLSQLARFDPTPGALTLERAPRVYAWVDVVDDLSGLEVASEGWIEREILSERLGGLLAELGRVYAPFLLANAAALEAGLERVETTIDGARWTQRPFPYQGKCLRWLRERYAALDESDRAAGDDLLVGTGCEALFR